MDYELAKQSKDAAFRKNFVVRPLPDMPAAPNKNPKFTITFRRTPAAPRRIFNAKRCKVAWALPVRQRALRRCARRAGPSSASGTRNMRKRTRSRCTPSNSPLAHYLWTLPSVDDGCCISVARMYCMPEMVRIKTASKAPSATAAI
jgi:hypothetical protein